MSRPPLVPGPPAFATVAPTPAVVVGAPPVIAPPPPNSLGEDPPVADSAPLPEVPLKIGKPCSVWPAQPCTASTPTAAHKTFEASVDVISIPQERFALTGGARRSRTASRTSRSQG